MKKKTTIVDIAQHLGITPSAVSKALSDHPRISDKTKQQVSETAKKLGYQSNSLATGLRKGRSSLIGVMVPGIHFSFFSKIIKSIEETLSPKGYSVIIAQSQDDHEMEKVQLESLLKAQVEGVIASVALGSKSYDHFREIANRLPVVLFDRTIRDLEVSKVMINDYRGSLNAVKHLFSQGYRKISHIAGYDHIEPFRVRIEGYKTAMKQQGISFPEDYIVQCKLTIEDGYRIANELLNHKDPPDAFFAASDLPAYGALRALLERGIKVPEEFGIIGFSNESFTSMVTPSISTIDQHSENMGLLAARAVMDQLVHIYDKKEFIVQENILTPKLIVRDSTKRE